MVSQAVITMIMINAVLAILIPSVLFIFLKKKYRISFKPVLFGILTFIVFAQIIEAAVHGILFTNETTAAMLDKAYVFVPYAVLMAGIFEETGRYVVMALFMKKYREWKDGLAFGTGHGGIEAVLILGLSNIMMLIYALQINNGTFDQMLANDAISEALLPVKEQLLTASPLLSILGPVERIAAITLHIAMSVIVLYALKSKQIRYLFYAIFLHALFDLPAALFQAGIFTNIYIIEAIMVLFAVCAVIFITRSRKWFEGV